MLVYLVQALTMPGMTFCNASDALSFIRKRQNIHILILADSYIRTSSAELEAISPERKDQAIALPDGGHYGTLSVFHELH